MKFIFNKVKKTSNAGLFYFYFKIQKITFCLQISFL